MRIPSTGKKITYSLSIILLYFLSGEACVRLVGIGLSATNSTNVLVGQRALCAVAVTLLLAVNVGSWWPKHSFCSSLNSKYKVVTAARWPRSPRALIFLCYVCYWCAACLFYFRGRKFILLFGRKRGFFLLASTTDAQAFVRVM